MLDLTVRDFVSALADRTPTPGGGSAGAAAGAMGVGLLAMASRFAQGKKREDAARAEAALAGALDSLDHRRELLLPMVERDAAAFGHVTEAYKLPKSDPRETLARDTAIQTALVGAMAVPEEVMCVIRDALRAFEPALEWIGRNIVSDVGAGTRLLEAAAEMSLLNVKINTAFLADRKLAEAATVRVAEIHDEIREHAARNHARVEELLGG